MNKITKTIWTLLSFFVLFMGNGYAQKIYQVDLHEEIGPNAWRTIKKAHEGATKEKAEYFLVDLNTFGGAVNFADSIRSKLLDSKIKTIVYVNNNAASAGALIALASDHIFMQKGGSIGAASVVNNSGEIMPEKYQSYMRGLMRATAEAKNRDPKIAEAFVDPTISLPQYKEDGKLLTFTAAEALKANVSSGTVSSSAEVYNHLNTTKPTIINHEVTFIDAIIGFLINPVVSGLLILGIIGGIYMELQSPGIGFPIVLALICGSLFFAPLYLQGLADHWEIALFVIGIILLALEILVIPGFGIPGIAGIICVLCGLAFSMVSNDYLDFKLTQPGLLMNSFLIVVGAMVLTVVLIVVFGKDLLKSSAFKRLVLQDEQTAETGFTASVPKINLINQHGVARTVLRPAGKIEIDGVWYDAVALDGFIDAGEEVYVEKHENYNLFVRKSSTKSS